MEFRVRVGTLGSSIVCYKIFKIVRALIGQKGMFFLKMIYKRNRGLFFVFT